MQVKITDKYIVLFGQIDTETVEQGTVTKENSNMLCRISAGLQQKSYSGKETNVKVEESAWKPLIQQFYLHRLPFVFVIRI